MRFIDMLNRDIALAIEAGDVQRFKKLEPIRQQVKKAMDKTPLQALRHHITGAIERGEKVAICEQTA